MGNHFVIIKRNVFWMKQAQMGGEGAKRFEEMLIEAADRDLKMKKIKDLGKVKFPKEK